MRYSIELRDRRYVKSYGFLSFAKDIGKSITNKCNQKLVDSGKKICIRCNRNCFKKGNSKNSKSNWRFYW